MNSFIEKNKRLLKFYYILSQIIGWSVLVKVGIDVTFVLIGYRRNSNNIALAMSLIYPLLLGFIALGVGRFIRYLYDMEYRAGWILRHLSAILYSYAGFYLISRFGLLYFHLVKWRQNAGPYYSSWQSFFENAIPVVAVMFIFVGLGQILKRIMPIIEEHKSLV